MKRPSRKVRLFVVVDPEQHANLKMLSRRDEISIGSLVRKALNLLLTKTKR